MIDLLFFLMLCACALQTDLKRFALCSVFVVSCVGHDIWFGGLSGDLYYLSASVASWLALGVMYLIPGHWSLRFGLMKICAVSVMFNFIGWVIWSLYLLPTAYNLAFVSVYVYALIKMFGGAGVDYVGNTSHHRYSIGVHSFNRPLSTAYCFKQGETQA